MKRPLLGLIAAASLLSACSPGLDLYTPPNARDYVASCARGLDALACKAMLPTLKTVAGEVTVLLVNEGNEEAKARLAAYLAPRGVGIEDFLNSPEAAKFARANIFLASKLTTGRMQTLDGKTHTVECRLEHQTEMCQIDGGPKGFNLLDGIKNRVGSVYTLMPDFLPF